MRTGRSVRWFVLLTGLAATAVLSGCGSHDEVLVSMTISPPSGTATHNSTSDTVQFTATGNFNNADVIGGAACVIPSAPDRIQVLNNATWSTSDPAHTSIDTNGQAKCLGVTNLPANITAVASSGLCGGVKAAATLVCN